MSSLVGHNFFKAYLAQPLLEGGSETTVYIDRIKTLNGETIATADFSDLSYGVVTINPEGDGITSYPENISFTGVDASALSLTTCVRGLSSKSASVVTANKRYHPIGTPVVISWGVHSWKLLKDYIDTSVAGFTSFFAPGTAGETVAAGNLIYFDDTDDEWKKCDADTAATVENSMLGIAQGAGTNGTAITGGVLLFGYDQNQTGLTVGAIYYASNTAGGISSTAGTKEVTIGFSRSTTTLYFNPRFNQQITENQQNLIVAIEGGTDFYGLSAVGTDAYAITVGYITAYVTGMKFRFKADVANTGNATLKVNSLAVVNILKANDQTLATNDIEAGQIVDVVYDGTSFQMQSQTSVTVLSALGDGSGLTSVGKVGINTTSVTFSATTVETTLFTVSIPGGTLSTNNGLRFTILVSDFDYTNNPTTITIRMKYGATTIATTATTTTAGASNVTALITGMILANNSASAQIGMVNFEVSDSTWPTSMSGYGTATEASGGALNLVITAQFSTATGSGMTAAGILVEKIK